MMGMTVETYFQNLNHKKVAVIGLGISNRPLVRMLLEHGIHVTCCDRTPREKLSEEVLELERMGAVLKLGRITSGILLQMWYSARRA